MSKNIIWVGVLVLLTSPDITADVDSTEGNANNSCAVSRAHTPALEGFSRSPSSVEEGLPRAVSNLSPEDVHVFACDAFCGCRREEISSTKRQLTRLQSEHDKERARALDVMAEQFNKEVYSHFAEKFDYDHDTKFRMIEGWYWGKWCGLFEAMRKLNWGYDDILSFPIMSIHNGSSEAPSAEFKRALSAVVTKLKGQSEYPAHVPLSVRLAALAWRSSHDYYKHLHAVSRL